MLRKCLCTSTNLTITAGEQSNELHEMLGASSQCIVGWHGNEHMFTSPLALGQSLCRRTLDILNDQQECHMEVVKDVPEHLVGSQLDIPGTP